MVIEAWYFKRQTWFCKYLLFKYVGILFGPKKVQNFKREKSVTTQCAGSFFFLLVWFGCLCLFLSILFPLV